MLATWTRLQYQRNKNTGFIKFMCVVCGHKLELATHTGFKTKRYVIAKKIDGKCFDCWVRSRLGYDISVQMIHQKIVS